MAAGERLNIEDLEHDEDLRLTHDGRPVDGEVVRLDAAGRVVESVTYKGGIQSGWTREYHPDGSLRAEYWYVGGTRRGTGREWHPNGRLRAEVEYLQGRVLSRREWDEAGNDLPVEGG